MARDVALESLSEWSEGEVCFEGGGTLCDTFFRAADPKKHKRTVFWAHAWTAQFTVTNLAFTSAVDNVFLWKSFSMSLKLL